jgi:hypothetical protein
MNRRKRIIGIFAVVLCGVLAVVFWPEKREPVYKGRKLSEWVNTLTSSDNAAGQAQAKEAIRAIGTNGIPLYLEWISYQSGLWNRFQNQIGAQARKWLSVEGSPDERARRRVLVAVSAFEDLGALGAPAVPMLVAYATNAARGDSDSQRVAITANTILANMGTAAAPEVLSLMTNGNAQVRICAVMTEGFSKDRRVVAQIQKSLEDSDPMIRATAAAVLKEREKRTHRRTAKP